MVFRGAARQLRGDGLATDCFAPRQRLARRISVGAVLVGGRQARRHAAALRFLSVKNPIRSPRARPVAPRRRLSTPSASDDESVWQAAMAGGCCRVTRTGPAGPVAIASTTRAHLVAAQIPSRLDERRHLSQDMFALIILYRCLFALALTFTRLFTSAYQNYKVVELTRAKPTTADYRQTRVWNNSQLHTRPCNPESLQNRAHRLRHPILRRRATRRASKLPRGSERAFREASALHTG